MKPFVLVFLILAASIPSISQDLSIGLIANDLDPHPMQPLAKPGYLETVVDPSFGTTIRRISNAQEGETIRTMYSTIQAWNADETRMILYKRPGSTHMLVDGFTYEYIKDLVINPSDLEEVFWHFTDPDILFYMDNINQDLIQYNVDSDEKTVLANLRALSNCNEDMKSGNDVQMMSWNSEIFSFRCGNSSTWTYHIPSETITEIPISSLDNTAVVAFPSGQRFLHQKDVYNSEGDFQLTLDIAFGHEHSCIGQDAQANDLLFSCAFSESPNGGCLGEVIAYDPNTGACRTIVGTELGYSYTQSGTHISSLAHKNTEGGWLVASMIGYDKDGQSLLDQELLIAQVTETASNVYRIGHHRSDKDEFGYWAEPHPVMSPTGTRVLFNSDWSDDADGFAVDAYVVELPSFSPMTDIGEVEFLNDISIHPNPVNDVLFIQGVSGKYNAMIIDPLGKTHQSFINKSSDNLNLNALAKGFYFLCIQEIKSHRTYIRKIFKK